jgi:hypothetical protein
MTDATALCVDCIADEVPEPRAVYAQDRCNPHYQRARRNGTLARVYRERGSDPAICEAACEDLAAVKGLCRSHYARKRKGLPNWADRLREAPSASCTATWTDKDGQQVTCGLPNHAKGLCGSHAWQKRNGKTLGPIRQRKSPGGKCGAKDCKLRAVHEGLCGTHYDRRRRGEGDWDRPIRKKGPHGEGYIKPDGYKVIYVDGRKTLEHIHVMEQHIGRRLRPKEQVHHLRGGVPGRSNNVLSNLELWTKQHPTGHRVVDVIAYTFEQQDLYLDLMDDDMLDTLTALGQRAQARRASRAAHLPQEVEG